MFNLYFQRLAPLVCAMATAFLVMLTVFVANGAKAQENNDAADEPPQILTTDLAQENKATAETMTVNFVFVDDNHITKITINGEEQQFEPSDTVMIAKELTFSRPQTLVVVEATDENGNTRKRSYLVYAHDYKLIEKEDKPFVTATMGWEYDTNPTKEFKQLIPIPGLDELEAGDNKPDSRLFLKVSGGGSTGPWSAFGGVTAIRYKQQVYDNFNVDVFFLGGQFAHDTGFFIRYIFADVDLGGYDYSYQHMVVPGWQLKSEEGQDESIQRLMLELVYKDFSRSEQGDDLQYALIWEIDNANKITMDESNASVSLGYSHEGTSEGFEVTEYNFVKGAVGFKSSWDNGFLLDSNMGLQIRQYLYDIPVAGDKRMDMILNGFIAPGYQFANNWKGSLSLRYMANISNKTQYERGLYGLKLEGSF